MTTPKDILGQLPGGRVLDVATGAGGFVHFLLEGLHSYTEIIGIDTNTRGEAAFTAAFSEKPGTHFQAMDALHMTFDDASFDLVCIANSLHHFDDPMPVLREMKRVLRPGGYILISEMYCDNQTETQQTHVALHHWWAAVDRASGVVHNETYRRDEIVGLVENLCLSNVRYYDLSDTADDPHADEILNQLNPAIDRYIQRAEGYADLQARGEQLRQRVKEIGFHSAASLLILGEKVV
jgi:SAM-dependent methyltransferase